MNIFYTIENICYILKNFIYSPILLVKMRRKIIKQGHNTLTITLPSKWAKNFNLKSGDEIEIIERDNGLFLSTEKKQESNKVQIDINDMGLPTI